MTRRGTPRFHFRLFIADDSPNSAMAIANLTAICEEYLPNRHAIEIIDVFRDPERALDDCVYMTPMLVRVSPLPEKRIVGTLSQTLTVVQALGLEARVA